MRRRMMKSKIHRATVTDANLDYVGSISLDPELMRRYLARLEQHGVLPGLYVLVGLAPLASARSARWIRDKLRGSVIPEALITRLEGASDPKAEGQRICVELMQQLREVRGVAGVHLMAPLNEGALPGVIREFRALRG